MAHMAAWASKILLGLMWASMLCHRNTNFLRGRTVFNRASIGVSQDVPSTLLEFAGWWLLEKWRASTGYKQIIEVPFLEALHRDHSDKLPGCHTAIKLFTSYIPALTVLWLADIFSYFHQRHEACISNETQKTLATVHFKHYHWGGGVA